MLSRTKRGGKKWKREFAGGFRAFGGPEAHPSGIYATSIREKTVCKMKFVVSLAFQHWGRHPDLSGRMLPLR